MIQLHKITFLSSETIVIDGEVAFFPEIRYQVDKEHPTDKSKRIRSGAYYINGLRIRAILNANQYIELLTFLQTSKMVGESGEGLYLTYGEQSFAYPITHIKSYPNKKDLEGKYNFLCDFELESTFKNYTGRLPEFTEFGTGNFGEGSFGY